MSGPSSLFCSRGDWSGAPPSALSSSVSAAAVESSPMKLLPSCRPGDADHRRPRLLGLHTRVPKSLPGDTRVLRPARLRHGDDRSAGGGGGHLIPSQYHFGMSKQIAVRLPEDLVRFVDEVVATGG